MALSAALAIMLATGTRAATTAQTLHLPYPSGTAVEIIQGYNGGTHVGVERYSLDIVRKDGATSGSPVIAPASGTVAFAQPQGGDHGCIGVTMNDSADFHYMLCHIILNHAYSYGDRIDAGQTLGTVGAPGLVGNNGTSHVHMQLYTLPGQQRTPMPFAPPQGIPLEGLTMPADGTYDQWACSGSACHGLVSAAPSLGQTFTASSGGSGTADPTGTTQPAATTMFVGETAVVQNTGDCLKIHAQPHMDAAMMGCVPDGTSVFIADGPSQADGHTWWDLRTLGWSVADYLRPASSTPTLGSTTPGSGTTPATAAIVPPPAPPPLPAAAAAPTANSTVSAGLSIGTTVLIVAQGDCLRVHESPSLDASVAGCLADGSRATLKDGPRSADGHNWWLLDSGGWAAAEYLQPAPTS